MIFAIDPGTDRSAWALMDGLRLVRFGIVANEDMHDELGSCTEDVAIEMIASYGMPVGAEVFETCVWIGRFAEMAYGKWTLIYRREVKATLCGNQRAGDANVRRAILDLYPRTGDGATPQVGTKTKPGPLYGVRKDIWAAIGVGITAQIKAGELAL